MRAREQTTILIMALIIIVSGLVILSQRNHFIELEQRFLDLSEKFDSQTTELDRLQSTLNEAEETLKQYNITLTFLEIDLRVKAANMIISRVGVNYFNEYFHDPTMRVTTYDANTTEVIYKYRIGVGEYVVDRIVSFYFHPNYVRSYGVPLESNLQPFTVTAEEAKKLAVDEGLPDGPYKLEAYIQYIGPGDVFPLTGDEEKYVWEVMSWNDPPWARTRTERHALVDPNTGQVYTIRRGGRGLVESQVDTTAEAKAQGIGGYVKLDYPELPKQIILTKSSNITFTLRVSFTSYNSSLQEVMLTVDPYYVDPYQVQSNLMDKLRDYVLYKPNGVITLRAGESIDIVVTLRVPDGVDQGFAFNRWGLDGLGIGVEGVLIISDLEV